jgi:organic radical activating enzyme
MKTYNINEIFFSFQGEGFNTGQQCIFIRFADCNLNCSFCDTDFSKKYEWSIKEILERIKPYNCNKVILTGGEPTLQIDEELLHALFSNFYSIYLETNGVKKIKDNFINHYIDWVTVSPKNKDFEQVTCDELKLVYYGQSEEELEFYRKNTRADHYYLQPESNKRKYIDRILHLKEWRLSCQVQKLINIK